MFFYTFSIRNAFLFFTFFVTVKVIEDNCRHIKSKVRASLFFDTLNKTIPLKPLDILCYQVFNINICPCFFLDQVVAYLTAKLRQLDTYLIRFKGTYLLIC